MIDGSDINKISILETKNDNKHAVEKSPHSENNPN